MTRSAPERCWGCKRVVDPSAAWCNFCGRSTSRRGRPRALAPTPGQCTLRDVGELEAALSSQDPVVVARALPARVAATRGGKPLLPPGCRLVLDRKTLTGTSEAGTAVIEANLLGPARSRWRLLLKREASGWKVARMERAAASSRPPAADAVGALSKSA